MRNPKGVALIILGIVERNRRRFDPSEMDDALKLGHWLLSQRADRNIWKHAAWGYHFDWAARAFFVPRGKPNAITTCYVARALYALGRATNNSLFTDAAIDAGHFLDSLHIQNEGKSYYGYIPDEAAFVHNASLWSAALVAETGVRSGDQSMVERALNVARQSASMQNTDGSWAYGTRTHHSFVDGFHTGYNLEALEMLQAVAKTTEFCGLIAQGLDYYKSHFILADGTVKYYNNRIWPLDTHSVAQAVVTLIKVGKTKQDMVLAKAAISRAYASLYLPKEARFVYQKGRLLTNRINYLRWTQAWAFYAFSLYLVRAQPELEDTDATH